MEDQEARYDTEIAPLMTQIIQICKDHGIPMVASFQLNNGPADDEDGGPLFCTTLLAWDGCDARIKKAGKVLYDDWGVFPSFVAMTITSGQPTAEEA